MSSKTIRNSPGEGQSTFTWWVTYEYDAEVKNLSKDNLPADYQSDYMRCWNYVKECGWMRENNFWISPDRRKKFKTVFEAYESQKYDDMVSK